MSIETRIAALEEQVNPSRVILCLWRDHGKAKPTGKVLAGQVAAFAKLRGVPASVVQPVFVSWRAES